MMKAPKGYAAKTAKIRVGGGSSASNMKNFISGMKKLAARKRK